MWDQSDNYGVAHYDSFWIETELDSLNETAYKLRVRGFRVDTGDRVNIIVNSIFIR
jgi:hypothetical protein